MNLTIGGKEYELRFGMDFINTLDNIYTQEIEGMQFGMGVESLVMYLSMKNPRALYNAIKAGTSYLNSKPSNQEIEMFVTEKATKDELEQLFEAFQKALEEAPLLKPKMKQFKANQQA